MLLNNETAAVAEKPAIPAAQRIEEDYLDCLLSEVEQMPTDSVVAADAAEENNLQCKPLLNTQLNTTDSFQCRLLHSCGITIAVPLDDMSQFIEIPDDLEINNRLASLCYGKFEWQNKQIFVLRMPLIIFDNTDEARKIPENEQKIIVLKNKNIAFMCNEIPGTVNVNPREVLWRDSNSRRLWMAGMVTKQGYAILDAEGLLQLMINGGKKHD